MCVPCGERRNRRRERGDKCVYHVGREETEEEEEGTSVCTMWGERNGRGGRGDKCVYHVGREKRKRRKRGQVRVQCGERETEEGEEGTSVCTMWEEKKRRHEKSSRRGRKVFTIFRSNFWRGRECVDDGWVQSKGQLVINLRGEKKIVQFIEYISWFQNKMPNLLWQLESFLPT